MAHSAKLCSSDIQGQSPSNLKYGRNYRDQSSEYKGITGLRSVLDVACCIIAVAKPGQVPSFCPVLCSEKVMWDFLNL